MAGRLDGKVALVSGAASGIGAAHARVFAAEGAKLVAGDLQEDKGRAVVEAVNASGGEAVFVHLDVTRQADWERAVGEAVSRFGKLTTLINNAGIYWPRGTEEETLEGWNTMISVNQTGVWLGMKAAVPAMREGGRWGDCQYLLAVRPDRQPGLDHLPRHQGRRAADDQVGRPGVRQSGHPGQLDSSGPDRYADSQRSYSRAERADQSRDADGTPGQAGGDRLRLALPVFG